jgi:hypothetical protein
LDIKLEFILGENDGFVISGRTAVEQITKSAAAAPWRQPKGGLRVFPHSTHELSTTTSSLRIGVASDDELLELNKVDTE